MFSFALLFVSSALFLYHLYSLLAFLEVLHYILERCHFLLHLVLVVYHYWSLFCFTQLLAVKLGHLVIG